MIANRARCANLRVVAQCLLCLILLACCTSGDSDNPYDPFDGPTDVSGDVVEARDSSAADTTSTDTDALDALDALDAGSDLGDPIDAGRFDSADMDAVDSSECASECVLGYNRDHQCCDDLLAEVVAGREAPGIYRRLLGCPCAASNEMGDDDRCSFDSDLDLVCPKWTWQGFHNGDGPDGDAEACVNRLDWIVENTRWIPLEDVTARDALREHVETLQPCPDPYGGEL